MDALCLFWALAGNRLSCHSIADISSNLVSLGMLCVYHLQVWACCLSGWNKGWWNLGTQINVSTTAVFNLLCFKYNILTVLPLKCKTLLTKLNIIFTFNYFNNRAYLPMSQKFPTPPCSTTVIRSYLYYIPQILPFLSLGIDFVLFVIYL